MERNVVNCLLLLNTSTQKWHLWFYLTFYYLEQVMLLLLFSHPVLPDSLQPHGLQHIRPPCPSSSLEVCPSSCPLHQWCHPAISSSDVLFSFCPQSFPAAGTFPMSWLFTSGDQNTGASASASVLLVNIQAWFHLRLIVLISLLSKELSGVFSSTTVQRHSLNSSKALFKGTTVLWRSTFFMVQLSQPYVTTGKTIALTIWTFVGRVMSLLLNTLSRFVIAFLPRSNRLLISWLQSPSLVILEPKKRKSITTFTFSPSICQGVMEPDAMILDYGLCERGRGWEDLGEWHWNM